MDKSYYLEYKLMVFLYGYFRQIDLSLDRSRWTLWRELQEYYMTQISPTDVIDFLLRYFNLSSDTKFSYNLVEPSLGEKLKLLVTKYFTNSTYLSEAELLYTLGLLKSFNDYLHSDIGKYGIAGEKLRIDITSFCYGRIERRLFHKDRKKTMSIEHFFENESINTVKMNEFSKYFFKS